jgi:putative tricarboxylic transport membrane protein
MVSDLGVGESRPPSAPARLGPFRDAGGLFIAIAMFALAAMIVYDATGYPVRRSYANFGPEIFPYIVASGIALLAALTLLLALRGWFPDRETMHLGSVFWVAGAVVAEIAVMAVGLGFALASGALFGLAARGMGRKPLWLTVAVGVVVSMVLYVLFRHGLGLSLPAGPAERMVDNLFR